MLGAKTPFITNLSSSPFYVAKLAVLIQCLYIFCHSANTGIAN